MKRPIQQTEIELEPTEAPLKTKHFQVGSRLYRLELYADQVRGYEQHQETSTLRFKRRRPQGLSAFGIEQDLMMYSYYFLDSCQTDKERRELMYYRMLKDVAPGGIATQTRLPFIPKRVKRIWHHLEFERFKRREHIDNRNSCEVLMFPRPPRLEPATAKLLSSAGVTVPQKGMVYARPGSTAALIPTEMANDFFCHLQEQYGWDALEDYDSLDFSWKAGTASPSHLMAHVFHQYEWWETGISHRLAGLLLLGIPLEQLALSLWEMEQNVTET